MAWQSMKTKYNKSKGQNPALEWPTVNVGACLGDRRWNCGTKPESDTRGLTRRHQKLSRGVRIMNMKLGPQGKNWKGSQGNRRSKLQSEI